MSAEFFEQNIITGRALNPPSTLVIKDNRVRVPVGSTWDFSNSNVTLGEIVQSGTSTFEEIVVQKIRSTPGGPALAAYNATETYEIGDIVFYNGCIYRSLAANNVSVPAANSANWMEISNPTNNKLFTVNGIIGNDAKAVEDCSSYPFQTLDAAYIYAVSLNPTGRFVIILQGGSDYTLTQDIAVSRITIMAITYHERVIVNIPTPLTISGEYLRFENLIFRADRLLPTPTEMMIIQAGYELIFYQCFIYYYVNGVENSVFPAVYFEPRTTSGIGQCWVTFERCELFPIARFVLRDTATQPFLGGLIKFIQCTVKPIVEDAISVNPGTVMGGVKVIVQSCAIQYDFNRFAGINFQQTYVDGNIVSDLNSPGLISMNDTMFGTGYTFTKNGTATFQLTDVVRDRTSVFQPSLLAGSYDRTSGPIKDYVAVNTYQLNDIVFYQGTIYKSLINTNNTIPTNVTNWQVISGGGSNVIESATSSIVPVSAQNVVIASSGATVSTGTRVLIGGTATASVSGTPSNCTVMSASNAVISGAASGCLLGGTSPSVPGFSNCFAWSAAATSSNQAIFGTELRVTGAAKHLIVDSGFIRPGYGIADAVRTSATSTTLALTDRTIISSGTVTLPLAATIGASFPLNTIIVFTVIRGNQTVVVQTTAPNTFRGAGGWNNITTNRSITGIALVNVATPYWSPLEPVEIYNTYYTPVNNNFGLTPPASDANQLPTSTSQATHEAIVTNNALVSFQASSNLLTIRTLLSSLPSTPGIVISNGMIVRVTYQFAIRTSTGAGNYLIRSDLRVTNPGTTPHTLSYAEHGGANTINGTQIVTVTTEPRLYGASEIVSLRLSQDSANLINASAIITRCAIIIEGVI
jgi:hypothetical protein